MDLPIVAKIIIIFAVLFFIAEIIGYILLRKKILKDLEEKNFKEIAKKINARNSNEPLSEKDIFNSTQIYETRFRFKKGKLHWSNFNDLFSNFDKKNVGAITESRSYLKIGSLTNFKDLNAFSLTKTKNDWIIVEIKDELINVTLNDKKVGTIYLRDKKIMKGNSIIGTLNYPDYYVQNIFTIYFDVFFNDKKAARLIASQNIFRNWLQIIPNLRIKTAEICDKLTKEQFAIVFGILIFLKIKNSIDNTSSSN